MKKAKVKTPDWILEGYDSKADYEKAKGLDKKPKKDGKTFKIRECPKCGSDDVGVVLSGSDSGSESEILSDSSENQIKEGGEWQCRKCDWVGTNIKEKELTEQELMEYLDKKQEEVA